MLHAKIEQIGIDTQNEVVKEEKRQRYDNQPYGQLLPTTMAMAYSEHPYQWTPIGSMEHLDAADHGDFMDFYETFYVPENATLSIAGDLDVTQTRSLIEKYFQDIPRGGRDIPRGRTRAHGGGPRHHLRQGPTPARRAGLPHPGARHARLLRRGHAQSSPERRENA